MFEAFELLTKSCQKFDLLFVNIQYATAYLFAKVTFEFQTAASVEPCQLFHRLCCANIHIQSLKVWLKSILPWLKYNIFSRQLFFYWSTLYYVNKST